jgi:hypothetical protein
MERVGEVSVHGRSDAPDDGIGEAMERFNAKTPAIYWPTIIAAETEKEWRALRHWVERLYVRFPHAGRVPPCWWQHNDLVELLSALRDYERASFAPEAPPTAAVEWHRAFRDIETRLEMWVKRLDCALVGREHASLITDEGWDAFIAGDVQARCASQRTARPTAQS